MSYKKITGADVAELLSQRFLEHKAIGLGELPLPSMLKNMDTAADRIVLAIHNGEPISLVSDFDSDGTVSILIVASFFEEIGIPLFWTAPDRFSEGYGISPAVISRLPEKKGVVITTDNGIMAFAAGKMAKELGIDLIITDHHLPPDTLPEAYTVIDQKQSDCTFPFPEICGAQIAWYLVAALKGKLNVDIDLKKYMGFASIAVISDMMPLNHGINKLMVDVGLKYLNENPPAPIKAFMEHLDKTTLTSEDIAFQIAPAINAAGRMDSSKWAAEFLLSKNIHDARIRLSRLIEFNDLRKSMEKEIVKEAILQVREEDKVIVVSGENWHEGIIGIAAARIGRKFNKPTIVFAKTENGELKGSGRSFDDCDLFSIVEESKDLLPRFGGHDHAVGCSILPENLNIFRERLQESYIKRGYTGNLVDPDILGELGFESINEKLLSLIESFEPFGQGNPRPKFITKNVLLSSVSDMGKEKNHRRFTLRHNNIEHAGVLFNTDEVFTEGTYGDVIYTINENHFRGRVTIQLMIESISSN